MFNATEALDKNRHGNLRFTPAVGFSFARGLNVSPLTGGEVVDAAVYYPVLFSKTEVPSPLALLGLYEENVYVDDNNQWTAPYVPGHIRRYPFILATGRAEGEFIVAIDPQAPHFKGENGEAVFNDQGELNEYSSRSVKFLEVFQRGIEESKVLLPELEQVLVEHNLPVFDGKAQRSIEGFRVVSQDKVNALDDATLARWARNGLLQLIHAHWSSLRHLQGVARASTARKERAEAANA